MRRKQNKTQKKIRRKKFPKKFIYKMTPLKHPYMTTQIIKAPLPHQLRYVSIYGLYQVIEEIMSFKVASNKI